MTITSDYAPQQYIGNGVTTVFSFPYPFYDNTDLIVSLTVISTGVTTPQILTTDYTVSGGGGLSGSITMVTAPTSAQRLTISRSIPYRQPQDYTENTAFPAETLEQGLDKAVVMAQQVKSLGDYTLKFPVTDQLSSIGEIPDSVSRANSVLSFDASGVPSAVALGSLVTSFDSVFTGLANNDLIKWNSSTSKWVNTPTIATAQIADLAVTPAKISSGAATSGQVFSADGLGGTALTTISAAGRLIDVQTFTASGTWTKPTGTTQVEVWVVGGGGGGGGWHASSAPTAGNGNTSSFGAHCSATGGSGGEGYDSAAPTQKWANGGSGSGGTQNFNGEQGRYVSGTSYANIGGSSLLSGQANGQEASTAGNPGLSYGGGGGGAFGSAPGCGGGGGGASYKYINSGLGATETVTVGTGGAGGTGTYAGGAGAAGIVIVKSYS